MDDNAYPIEKGIPIPKQGTYRVPLLKAAPYPFKNMEVGDSFFVGDGTHRNVNQSIRYWQGKLKGRRFTQRRFGHGIRVWRTE